MLVGLVGCASDAERCNRLREHGGTPSEDSMDACRKLCDAGDDESCSTLAVGQSRLDKPKQSKADREAATAKAKAAGEYSGAVGAAIMRVCDGGHTDIETCATSCEAGEAGACLRAALLLEFGTKDIDPVRALDYYEKGCRLHESEHACLQPASIMLPMWEEHVKPGMGTSMVETTKYDGDDLGEKVMVKRKRQATRGACKREQGDRPIREFATECARDCFSAQACERYASLRCVTDVPGCEAACEAGDAAMCRELYVAYRDGQGVTANPATAQVHRGKACKLGDEWSCNSGESGLRSIPRLEP